jgi:hypothetical protein
MIDALDGASNLQLYQRKAFIEGMLADLRQTMEACASLHPGQPVRFVDFRTGQLRQGKVIAKHPTQATVFEEAVRRSWKIPYVSVEAAETTPGTPTSTRDVVPLQRELPAGRACPTIVMSSGRYAGEWTAAIERTERFGLAVPEHKLEPSRPYLTPARTAEFPRAM